MLNRKLEIVEREIIQLEMKEMSIQVNLRKMKEERMALLDRMEEEAEPGPPISIEGLRIQQIKDGIDNEPKK